MIWQLRHKEAVGLIPIKNIFNRVQPMVNQPHCPLESSMAAANTSTTIVARTHQETMLSLCNFKPHTRNTLLKQLKSGLESLGESNNLTVAQRHFAPAVPCPTILVLLATRLY